MTEVLDYLISVPDGCVRWGLGLVAFAASVGYWIVNRERAKAEAFQEIHRKYLENLNEKLMKLK